MKDGQFERFAEIYRRLRSILEPYASKMNVTADGPEGYSLDTRHVMKNGKPLFFGAVQAKKNDVSFHVMPVYVLPELLKDGGDLKKRIQGKSCFNFQALDDDQVVALEHPVREGYERYAAGGHDRREDGWSSLHCFPSSPLPTVPG